MVDWLRDYALLGLRLNRLAAESGQGGLFLDYRGPKEWAEEVANAPLPAAEQLVAEAETLAETLERQGLDGQRVAFLSGQVEAFRTVARQLAGERLTLRELVRGCLDLAVDRMPESELEAAYELLDAGLPGGAGSLAERLHAWQDRHTLPRERTDRIPAIVERAIAETRARTTALLPIPADQHDACQLMPGASFLAAGHYQGNGRATLFINSDLPFILADLLYTVAHEAYPGHIAEAVCKELHLIQGKGHIEQQLWPFPSPRMVVSEGMGLWAQELVFPGDGAQAWLVDNVLRDQGIPPDGSDFATIHRAKTILLGAWCDAMLMAEEGRPEEELRRYLTDRALLREAELEPVLALTRASGPGGGPYLFGYYHGWRLLEPWVRNLDRSECVRRLLTEPLSPNQLRDPLPAGGP